MTILGIDPGLADTGYGVIKEKDSKVEVIAYGCIKTAAKLPHPERLGIINSELKKIIKKFKPELVAVEQLFFFKNVKSALQVGEARGVVLLTARQAKINLSEFTPLQVKQAVTGYGRAEKLQIQKMLQNIFSLDELPKPDDAADALAVAYCAAQSAKLKNLGK